MRKTSTSPSTSESTGWSPGRVRFFPTRRELRSWFETNHARAPELWIGFYKAHVGRTAVGYGEAVEEALCFGWIDTTVRRIDTERYTNRFVPRRPHSRWSPTNRAAFRALDRAGRVTDAGRAAFARAAASWAPSYARRARGLSRGLRQRFRSDSVAWAFFARQPPGYRWLAAIWVMSGKKEATRVRRLEQLIRSSRVGRRPGAFPLGKPRGDKRTHPRSPSERAGPRAVK